MDMARFHSSLKKQRELTLRNGSEGTGSKSVRGCSHSPTPPLPAHAAEKPYVALTDCFTPAWLVFSALPRVLGHLK